MFNQEVLTINPHNEYKYTLAPPNLNWSHSSERQHASRERKVGGKLFTLQCYMLAAFSSESVYWSTFRVLNSPRTSAACYASRRDLPGGESVMGQTEMEPIVRPSCL